MDGERRRAPRAARPYMIRYRVPLGAQPTWMMSPLRDLSTIGARFMSETSFEVGAVLDLELNLPTAKGPTPLRARVVWVKRGVGKMSEIGVAFLGADPAAQQTIERAIAGFLRKQSQ